jgi:hypothetical protein
MLIALAAMAASPTTVEITPVAPPPIVAVKTTDQKTVEKKKSEAMDFTKMMAVFDKLFPPQPDPDPARLAAARGVAIHMWPDGTYGMLLDSFVGSMANTVLDLKPADLAMFDDKKSDNKDGGKKPLVAAKDPNLTLRDQLRSDDPYFDKRVAAITAALRTEFARMSPLLEPNLREGLSRALARRFTEPQLADLNVFYRSPTGQAYARESLKMWFDSDVMRSTINSMPTLILQLPGAMQRVETAAKSFPMPPKKQKDANEKK